MANHNFVTLGGREARFNPGFDFRDPEQFGDQVKPFAASDIVREGLTLACRIRIEHSKHDNIGYSSTVNFLAHYRGKQQKAMVRRSPWHPQIKIETDIPVFDMQIGVTKFVYKDIGYAGIAYLVEGRSGGIHYYDQFKVGKALGIDRYDDRLHFGIVRPNSLYCLVQPEAS